MLKVNKRFRDVNCALLLTLAFALSGCVSTANSTKDSSSQTDKEIKNEENGFLSSMVTSGSKILSDVLYGDGDISERTKNAVYSETNKQASETLSENIDDETLRKLSAVVLLVPEDTIKITNRKTYLGATMFIASTSDGRHFKCIFDIRNHEARNAKLVECSR